ncbi:hypothetical protein [Candidatus Magnetomonas plexicatena]|uniref:hypothetical protein n=1 Tax=Candidatus Magnetomonas plexicatena TaxID=2552947 RepID=UPI001C7542B7|nr:hypothetical protein E2O03_002945 [Nitrospirales bacterium LBB_01]
MDSIINKLYFSEKAKQILTNEKTKNRIHLFMGACAKTHKEYESKLTCKTRLDAHLLYTALASACIDLHSSNHIHDMKDNNPSPSKKGASIAS